MNTRTIRQTVIFALPPQDVYGALMNSARHSAFTGSKAVISKKVGGNFTAYNGYCEGKNLELVEGKKIVQSWRASDWPSGVYSKVTIIIEEIKEGTRLTFVQENIPEEFYDDIKQGWDNFYWKPMKEMMNN